MNNQKFKDIYKKFGITAIINVILVVGWVFFVTQLTPKAKIVKEANNQKLAAASAGDLEVLKAELASNADKINTMKSFFINEDALLNFTKQMDTFRAEGVASDFSFASDKLVTDKEGNQVLPFSVTFTGSEEKVNEALSKLENLPYIIKAVESELDRPSVGGNIVFVYRGFIYVSDKFAQNQ
jgi:hypothetical protein